MIGSYNKTFCGICVIPNLLILIAEAKEEERKYIEEVAEELKTHYLNKTCQKQLFPWESDRLVALQDFYVQLTLDIEIQRPNKPIKQRLPDYHVIFKDEEDRRRFVLEGRPGLGKSTFCAKVAYDWSHRLDNENSPLNHIKLLFVLRLGSIDSANAIEEVIFDQLLPRTFKIEDPDRTKKLRKVIEKLGKAVVVVFDSLDEADPRLFLRQEVGSIVKIMQFEDLRPCRVLVTSRPWRVKDITKYAEYRRLELQAFTKSDILEYVKRFFVSDRLLGERLEQYIKANRLVVDASIPLITLLICWYWQKTNAKEIPERLGEVYDGVFDVMYQLSDKKSVSKVAINSFPFTKPTDSNNVCFALMLITRNCLIKKNYSSYSRRFQNKGELQPKLKLSMFCALSQNYQHCLEK